MNTAIRSIHAREILGSRGNPTVEAQSDRHAQRDAGGRANGPRRELGRDGVAPQR
jgi:hypothetical protein